MAIYFGDKKIKHIYFGDRKIKKCYFGDTKLWSGASLVTYVYNGQTITEEIDEGLNCATKTVTIAGATFLGWTTNNTSTTPMTNIPATGEPMTLYAIWTKSVSISLGDSTMMHSSRTYTKVVTTGSAFNVRVYGTLSAHAGSDDERTTNTLYLNEQYIKEVYAHKGNASASADYRASGVLNGVTVKYKISPHGSSDEGYGSFSGTCTYTGIG